VWWYRLAKQVAKAEESLNKLKVTKNSKEELKTVALGTSKINYLDPRITVAWCKRKDVPLEKIFNKSLLGKFTWAMEVEPEFAF
jgi:DNA topoisomerase I